MNNLAKEEKWLLEEKYNGHICKEFEKDKTRLKNGEPLAYIIGSIPFNGLKICLNEHTLIPRTETEYWVTNVLDIIKKTNNEQRKLSFLDIFSGSGCIGLSILEHFPDAHVVFSDNDPNALEQIKTNISINNMDMLSYDIIQSDVFLNISNTFDYIFANPPYIDQSRNEVEQSVLEHEPHAALFADEHGLYFVKQLIKEAPRYLNNHGELYIEFDSWQKDDIERLLTTTDVYTSHEFFNDQYKQVRVLRLTL